MSISKHFIYRRNKKRKEEAVTSNNLWRLASMLSSVLMNVSSQIMLAERSPLNTISEWTIVERKSFIISCTWHAQKWPQFNRRRLHGLQKSVSSSENLRAPHDGINSATNHNRGLNAQYYGEYRRNSKEKKQQNRKVGKRWNRMHSSSTNSVL